MAEDSTGARVSVAPLEEDIVLQERVQQMLDHCELTNVRVIEYAGQRVSPSEAASVNVSSETSYVATAELFANRYQWRAELVDEGGEPVANMEATLLVEFDLFDGFEPDQEAAEAIAESTGYFAAYPYVRELFQTGCARLQLNPLVLGMLLAGSSHPRRVSTSTP